MKRGSRKEPKHCPIDGCIYQSGTFIDLLRHMNESDRRLQIEHQDWLRQALGEEFAAYAFRNDRRIANLFARYYRETGKLLPNDPQEFYDWFSKKPKRHN